MMRGQLALLRSSRPVALLSTTTKQFDRPTESLSKTEKAMGAGGKIAKFQSKCKAAYYSGRETEGETEDREKARIEGGREKGRVGKRSGNRQY